MTQRVRGEGLGTRDEGLGATGLESGHRTEYSVLDWK